MKVAAVVPSLNPNERFRGVVDGLVQAGFERIYVVDDGSGEEYRPLFAYAESLPQCVLLRHSKNEGKGRALKTAIQHYLQNPDDLAGLVTLDADGQHATVDAVKVAQALLQSPNSLVLGARDFSAPGVPPKSKNGNRITSWVFRHMLGLPITDTQTGLRGIPNAFAQRLLAVKGERYEFETNMLLEAKRAGLAITEVPITVIYFDDNAASHFQPVRDSVRIYFLIIKFLLSSLSSALLDFGLFTLLHEVLLRTFAANPRLFWANGIARVCSALFNFTVNKKVVFESQGNTGGALLRYAVLAVVQLGASTAGIHFASMIMPVLPAKILVDTTLFFISFAVQRRWVFRY